MKFVMQWAFSKFWWDREWLVVWVCVCVCVCEQVVGRSSASSSSSDWSSSAWLVVFLSGDPQRRRPQRSRTTHSHMDGHSPREKCTEQEDFFREKSTVSTTRTPPHPHYHPPGMEHINTMGARGKKHPPPLSLQGMYRQFFRIQK